LSADDVAETQTQCEVDLEDQRLAVVRLKAQVRALCAQSNLADIHALFEEDVQRLVTENEALRRRNLMLETKDVYAETELLPHQARLVQGAKLSSFAVFVVGTEGTEGTKGTMGTVGTEGTEEVAACDSLEGGRQSDVSVAATTAAVTTLLAKANKEKSRLVSKLHLMVQEKEDLRGRFEELCRRERQGVLSAKLAGDASRRLHTAQQDVVRLTNELESERTLRSQTASDLELVRADACRLQESERAMRNEWAAARADQAVLTERVRELDDERRKLAQLNNFVVKHSPSQHSAQHAGGFGGSGNHPVKQSTSVLSVKTSKSGHHHLSTGSHENVNPNPHPNANSHPNPPNSYTETTDPPKPPAPGVPDSDSCALDAALSVLHEGIVTTASALLPVFRRLSNEIRLERTRHATAQSKGCPTGEAAVTAPVPVAMAVVSSSSSSGSGSGSAVVTTSASGGALKRSSASCSSSSGSAGAGARVRAVSVGRSTDRTITSLHPTFAADRIDRGGRGGSYASPRAKLSVGFTTTHTHHTHQSPRSYHSSHSHHSVPLPSPPLLSYAGLYKGLFSETHGRQTGRSDEN
jgi:hypothetical protein